MSGRPSVCYLLDGTELSGGVKVVLHHANLLCDHGHEVTVASNGPRPGWYRLRAEFRQVDWHAGEPLPPAEVTVATYWTTIETVAAAGRGQPLHFCQGYEGDFPHTAAQHEVIEAAYRAPLPAITVTPHLKHLLERRFGRPARVVTPALDSGWRPAFRRRPARRPRILVPGIFEAELKGVRTALGAVRLMRERGFDCDLVRLSPWPLCEEESELLAPDEYHAGIAPAAVPALVRGCDLAVLASSEVEGFGLPLAEAMASGVPAVASRIPSFSFVAGGAARLVPFDDADAFATAAAKLLSDPAAWRALRRRGRETSRRFAESPVSEALVAAVEWAAGGAWKQALVGEALDRSSGRAGVTG